MDVVKVTFGLTPELAEEGYRQGCFPMGTDMGVFTWHRPPRRAVIPLDSFHVSRSLARTIRKHDYDVTYDKDFTGVMRGCAEREETWITAEFYRVYGELFRRGKAHSVEVWVDGQLAGGVYGVHLGAAFFAESKFHRVRDMSKVALYHLASRLRERGFLLLEVQYLTEHLRQFGTIEMPHREYAVRLKSALARECAFA